MADRLASYADLQAFLKGGADIDSSDERGVRLGMILDGVSRRMMTYILRSSAYSLAQSSGTENYGIEHYGLGSRNRIRLKRFPVVAITSVIDNQNPVTADEYAVDYENAILYRSIGKFYPLPRAVQIVYTAGYPVAGAGDTQAIQVPVELRNACLEQCGYEFSQLEPGSVPLGATTVSRPDGSIVVKAEEWLTKVQAVMDSGYRR